MDPNTFPTKGNLILAKNSLALSRQGFDLMDKKRNILIRELMGLIEQAKDIQSRIDSTFREAYAALQRANMEMGITNVQTISYTVPIEDSIRIKTRSIMGTEIPLVESQPSDTIPTYAFYSTKESLDEARAAFEKVNGGKFRLPSCRQHQKDTEARQRAEEYHDPSLRGSGEGYFQCTGGKRARGIYKTEGH